ncbi:MAG TPA: hypothetical protein PLX23_03630 [Candidatus Hydrogenedens sp.]|nr:hypothetical protein [Candidatus Hydrogenedens sp.]
MKNLYLLFSILVAFHFICFTPSYSEEQKKPDAVTQPPQKIEQTQKEKENSKDIQKEVEQTSSTNKETSKKKIPVFWFLLPEE